MSLPLSPSRPILHPIDARRRAKAGWVGFAALTAAVVLALHGPIAQWADYHHFADTRSWLGVPNAANVFTNLPFAFVGAWGLVMLSRRNTRSPGSAPWWMFSGALVATALASAHYHLAPSNIALVGDRLPIAWACAALTCAFLGERVSARWAAPRTLAIAFVVSTLSVAWWWFTERRGLGDLRPYLYVQFVPMIVVPLGLLLRLSPLSRAAPSPQASEADAPVKALVAPDRAWWAVLAIYALAKVLELGDAALWAASNGAVSGHALKHLAAAGAAALLLRAVLAQRAAPRFGIRYSPASAARPMVPTMRRVQLR